MRHWQAHAAATSSSCGLAGQKHHRQRCRSVPADSRQSVLRNEALSCMVTAAALSEARLERMVARRMMDRDHTCIARAPGDQDRLGLAPHAQDSLASQLTGRAMRHDRMWQNEAAAGCVLAWPALPRMCTMAPHARATCMITSARECRCIIKPTPIATREFANAINCRHRGSISADKNTRIRGR